MNKSGAFDVDDFEISSTDLSESAHEEADKLTRFTEAFNQVLAAGETDPVKRRAIFNKVARGTITDIERALEREMYREMLKFQQQVDSFVRTRRRIIDTFMLSITVSPCSGRRFQRHRLFSFSRYEVCQAPEIKEKMQLRQIIETNKAFLRDLKARLRNGEKPADIKNRLFTGEYGL